MSKSTTMCLLLLTVGAMAATVGCGSDKATTAGLTTPSTAAKAPEGSAGFPVGVPTPSLPMLSAVNDGGTFTMRYKTTDSRTDIAAYEKLLDYADFTKTGEVDALDGQQRSLTTTAMKDAVHVEASAYAPDAADGGNYMEVMVETS